MTGHDAPSSPLDVPTLEVLGQRAATHGLVTGWRFRPDSIASRVLEIQLDDAQYPPAVDAARIDCRWFVSGDYTVHYQ